MYVICTFMYICIMYICSMFLSTVDMEQILKRIISNEE